ncbi:MAG: phosphatase PAP2 family protein [Xenococcaceae cyanobacterium MO_167.B52]|nr:phosphatase PAP2 family protein [Xenococcaceae cyanobacterium MO_167.B52]
MKRVSLNFISTLLSVGFVTAQVQLTLPANAATVVSDWVGLAVKAVRNSPTTGDLVTAPTSASRAYGLLGTSMYDAWSAYETLPTSTVVGDILQRPSPENTLNNKREAVSYAAYGILSELFPNQVDIFREQMFDLGFNPDNTSTDPTTAAGIGNVMAERLMEFRRFDGSNQLGNYEDTSNYSSRNTTLSGHNPMVNDITRWTAEHIPIDDLDASIQKPLTPQWGKVIPFALSESSQFRPREPTPFLLDPEAKADLQARTIIRSDGTEVNISRELIGKDINSDFISESEEIIAFSANLTDEQKIIAEYWEDPAGTPFPPGHWLEIGQFVSQRDSYTLDEDAQLFFALGNGLMDAGIATWEAKYFYDYARPVRTIRELGRLCLIGTEKIVGSGECYIDAWGAIEQKTKNLLATDFITYQTPGSDPSPPFPEYTSGHSAFSTAGAEILKLFSGSDAYGSSITFPSGSSRFEPGFTPKSPVILSWETFSEAANEAGISRLYGGIHFVRGDIEGRKLGRKVATEVWQRSQFFINGGKTVPEPSSFGALLLLGGGVFSTRFLGKNPRH